MNMSVNIVVPCDDNQLPTKTTEVTTRLNAVPKLLYLDGLRGILCLIVVFSHSLLMGKSIHEEKFSIFFYPWMQHSPLRLLVAGEFAVAGFFVLSGCVLVRRYLENFSDTTVLLSGLIRRFPRLFIPSSVALFLYFAILHFRSFYGFNECHEIGEGSVDAESIGFGYVLLNTFGQYFWMSALYTIQWTMQIEFIVSIFVYFLAFLVTRPLIHRYRLIFYAFLLLILPVLWIATRGGIPKPVHYIQPFSFGLLLSDLDASGYLNVFNSMRRCWAILFKVGLIILTLYFSTYPVFNTDIIQGKGTIWFPLGWMFDWFWISLGGFCLLLFSMISTEMQSFLSTRVVHFLGKISFGIYLTHYIMLCIMDVSFVQWTAPHIGRDLAMILGLIIFALPMTFLVSYAFYIFVDAPAVQLSAWFYYIMMNRCLKSLKPPQPIKKHIWIVLLVLCVSLIVVSAIPSIKGSVQCDYHPSLNRTVNIIGKK